MAEIYSKIPGLRINFISVFIYFFLNANKKTDQQRMNSPKHPIITCAPLERLTPSHACQSPETAFFRGPCHPALYNNNDHNNKIFYFPYWGLQGCTSQQVARANLGRPVNLPAGIFNFTWLKWGKIILGEKKKIQCIKDLQRLKFSEKNGISSFSCASSLFYSRLIRPTDLPW